MIWCNSKADSKVWIREDVQYLYGMDLICQESHISCKDESGAACARRKCRHICQAAIAAYGLYIQVLFIMECFYLLPGSFWVQDVSL